MWLVRGIEFMDDNEIQIEMDDIAKALLKRGMSAEKINDYLIAEAFRIQHEIEDGEFEE